MQRTRTLLTASTDNGVREREREIEKGRMTFGKLNHRRRESIATSLHDRVMTRNSIEEGIGLYDQNVFAIFFFLSGRAPNRRFIIRRFLDSVSPFAFVHFVVRICYYLGDDDTCG